MRELFVKLSYIRTLLAYLAVCIVGKLAVVKEDIEGAVNNGKPANYRASDGFAKLNAILATDIPSRNIIFYRIKENSKVLALLFSVI